MTESDAPGPCIVQLIVLRTLLAFYAIWLLFAWATALSSNAQGPSMSLSDAASSIGRSIEMALAAESMHGWQGAAARRVAPSYEAAVGEAVTRLEAVTAAYQGFRFIDPTESERALALLAVLRAERARAGWDPARESWRGDASDTAFADTLARAYPDLFDRDSMGTKPSLQTFGEEWVDDLIRMRVSEAEGRKSTPDLQRLAGRGTSQLLALFCGRIVYWGICVTGAGIAARWALSGHRRQRRGTASIPPPWPLETALGVFAGAHVATIAAAAAFTNAGSVALERWAYVESVNDVLQLIEINSEAAAVLSSTVAIVILWILSRHLLMHPTHTELRAAFGLRMRITDTIAWTLVLLAFVQAGDVVLTAFGGSARVPTNLRNDGSPWIVPLVLVSAAVLAPVLEEVSFRGLLYGSLRREMSPSWAGVASACVFALAHVGDGDVFLRNLWLGLVLALGYEYSRSLLPPLLAHAAYSTWLFADAFWL